MIDLDKIEAAAKTATPGPWYSSSQFRDDEALFVTTLTPTEDDGTILCRIRNTVSGRPLNDFDYANADHIATANPATVLEMVIMIRERDAQVAQLQEQLERSKSPTFDGRFGTWQAACGKARRERDELAEKLVARDAVLKQALEALEASDSVFYPQTKQAIAAIKGILG